MSYLTLALFFIFATLASQAMSRTLRDEAIIAEKYNQWMTTYGRKYDSESEKEKRFKIFKDNLEYIESFNNGGNRSYELGLNEFADMTRAEFLAVYTGGEMPPKPTTRTPTSTPTSFRYEYVSDVPNSLDWREKGSVVHVKQQKSCAAYWAFSAAAAMEGLGHIKTGKLISISDQQIVDCSRKNFTCDFGWINLAYIYVMENDGITSEENYPYKGMLGSCDKTKAKDIALTITDSEQVPSGNETALLNAVANQPVSVEVDASDQSFISYKSGIYSGPCGTDTVSNHAMTIVGYGKSEEGKKYWLAKNSWGESWGEKGYMRMEREFKGKLGLCGIAQRPSFPVI